MPAASQLASVSFDSGSPPAIPGTYTVPNDPVWTNPGPAAGPFQVRIDDGNVVTYYWYRFEDQPAIMKAGLTQAERAQLGLVGINNRFYSARFDDLQVVAPSR